MYLLEEEKNKIIEFLVDKLKPKFIYLFGFFARGEGRENSDLDLAVYLDPPVSEYDLYLINSDLSFEVKRDVHLVDLRNVSTVFAAQIVSTREVLYCEDEILMANYEIRVLKMGQGDRSFVPEKEAPNNRLGVIGMPRTARKRAKSGIYHVMLRGINRQNIFEDDEDRRKLLKIIGHFKLVSNYELFSYCLMNNHFHLLIKENSESISMIIKRIAGSYVHWYNSKYERCGHLFQERFKSEAVDSSKYFLTVLRYIHQNPVKAGLSEDVGKFKWSSYGEYLGNVRLVDVDYALNMFSEDRRQAIRLYERFMNEENEDKCLDYEEKIRLSDEEVIKHIRRLTSNAANLQQLEKSERDKIIKELKSLDGVTVRQLARITGISKSVIGRI
ncbi:MAG TPA: hypothetical protein GXX38_09895 [Clostridia bacterium]|nr:hypothetical protein [Clostridia bacterium]